MTNQIWTPATPSVEDYDNNTIAAFNTTAGNAEINFYLTYDGSYSGHLEIIVNGEDNTHHYTTQNAKDFPEIEKHLPRSEWPTVIYAGKKHETRNTNEQLNELIFQAIQNFIKEEISDCTDLEELNETLNRHSTALAELWSKIEENM